MLDFLTTNIDKQKTKKILLKASTEGLVLAAHPSVRALFYIKEEYITKISLTMAPAFSCLIFGSSSLLLNLQILNWCIRYANKPFSKYSPLPLNFSSNLLPTHVRILKKMQKISFGTTTTYNALAESLHIEDVKEVTSVCENNPFPLLLPCHRILHTKSLGQASYGTVTKKALLKFEHHARILCS